MPMSLGTMKHAAARVPVGSMSSAEPEPQPGPQDEPQHGTAKPAAPIHCRTNSRRGATDPAQRSYPPVQSVRRAFSVLRAVNELRIASVHSIHKATGFPKPTIVRLLETLVAEGYVARDNMCGGYGVTRRVHELTSGYQGISQVLDAARAPAVALTQRLKWPIGIGVLDGDAIAIKFWTGTISPCVHTNTVLGLRPDFATTAMGRAYLAFCPDGEREQRLRQMREDPARNFEEDDERHLRALLQQARHDGYTMRDPKTKPYRITTLAMPIREGETIHALVSISFFTTALAKCEIAPKIVSPLRTTIKIIEDTIAAMNSGAQARHETLDLELAF
jgi:IclR family transcriptional regulator, mhp operon transcriptional activator